MNKKIGIGMVILLTFFGWGAREALGAKKVSVQDIMNKCCFQEQVEITGTITGYDVNATANTYFYYLQDDYMQPIKVTASGKPDLKPGQRVTVTGIVSLSPVDGFYLTEQARKTEGGLADTKNPLFWLIIASAVILVALIIVIIFFLMSQGKQQQALEAQRSAQAHDQAGKLQGLEAQLEADRRAREQKDLERIQEAIRKPTEIRAPVAPPTGVMAPRYRQGFLKIIQGPETGATLQLKDTVTAIGREVSNDIVLKDDRVSGSHARIEFQDGTFYLADANSRNGTYVNQNRLTARCALIDGYKIRMGGVEMVFIGVV